MYDTLYTSRKIKTSELELKVNMKLQNQRKKGNIGGFGGSWGYFLPLLLIVFTLNGGKASAQVPAATIAQTGSIVISNGTIVPPPPPAGKWTEGEKKSHDKYILQSFSYVVPKGPPTLYLFVATDQLNSTPDGVFEIGLVRGFVNSFGAENGFKFQDPIFRKQKIGTSFAQATSVEMKNDKQTIWALAYSYPGRPSLTFLVVSGRSAAKEDIEKYLSEMSVK